MTPPSRQDDGNVRAPALVCLLVACEQDCTREHVVWWLDCGVVLPDTRKKRKNEKNARKKR